MSQSLIWRNLYRTVLNQKGSSHRVLVILQVTTESFDLLLGRSMFDWSFQYPWWSRKIPFVKRSGDSPSGSPTLTQNVKFPPLKSREPGSLVLVPFSLCLVGWCSWSPVCFACLLRVSRLEGWSNYVTRSIFGGPWVCVVLSYFCVIPLRFVWNSTVSYNCLWASTETGSSGPTLV